jgi:cell division protein FtsQ
MERGGRVAGSLKKPKPASAGGLASGWRAARRPAKRERAVAAVGTTRTAQEQGRLIARLERFTPRGAGVAATLFILIGSAVFGAVRGDHVEEMVTGFRDARDAVAKSAGFSIASVTITGSKQLSHDEVLAIGGITGRRSLLFLDAADVRERLKASPWIADATVLKLYPDRLSIDITERKAFALWQDDKRVSVIAEDGAVLEPYVARRFIGLPLVVGKGAEARAKDFLHLIAAYPQLKQSVKAVVLVGERRWNLRLASGLDIRLPETGVEAALDRLTRLDRDDRLLSRDIVAVDLRLPDRVTVRLSDEAAQARADALKAKTKKKASDA